MFNNCLSFARICSSFVNRFPLLSTNAFLLGMCIFLFNSVFPLGRRGRATKKQKQMFSVFSGTKMKNKEKSITNTTLKTKTQHTKRKSSHCQPIIPPLCCSLHYYNFPNLMRLTLGIEFVCVLYSCLCCCFHALFDFRFGRKKLINPRLKRWLRTAPSGAP